MTSSPTIKSRATAVCRRPDVHAPPVGGVDEEYREFRVDDVDHVRERIEYSQELFLVLPYIGDVQGDADEPHRFPEFNQR